MDIGIVEENIPTATRLKQTTWKCLKFQNLLLTFIIIGLGIVILFYVSPLRTSRSIENETIAIRLNEKTYKKMFSEGVSFPRKKRASIENNKSELCCTPGCVFIAANILNNMDSKVDPCEDFYEFTCGNYIKNHQLRGARSISTLSEMAESIYGKVRELVSEPIASDDIQPFVLMKKLYQSCTNIAQIERLGLQPLREKMNEVGGWPVTEGASWNETEFHWEATMIKLRKIGYYPDSILRVNVFPDLKNSSRYLVYILEPLLHECRGCTAEEKDRHTIRYLWIMVDLAVKFGADPVEAFAELRDSAAFESKLASIMMNDDISLNLISIKDLQSKYPYVSWLQYLNDILILDKPLSEEDSVVMTSHTYFSKLNNLLNTTSDRNKANHIIWRMVADSLSYLSSSLKLGIKYDIETTARIFQLNRRDECVKVTSHVFSIVVGSLYIRRYFEKDIKLAVQEMVNILMDDVRKSLLNAKWMDNATRSAAEEKTKTLRSVVGYPDELLNDTALIQYYEGLVINEQKYFETILEISKFNQRNLETKLWKPVVKADWVTHGSPIKVNAFYYANENVVGLPAAILQSWIFALDRPNYVNYATIGFIIGHELSHAFYDPGRKFDEDGNYSPWWQNITLNNFASKAKCIDQQYGNFTDYQTGVKLNSKNTFAENLADNSGIELAYQSYTTWKSNQEKDELLLPGLEKYTEKQLFWMSLGSAWCSKDDRKYLPLLMKYGDHSPNKYRIIGIVSNQQSFADDFHCSSGSKMNVKQKCKIW